MDRIVSSAGDGIERVVIPNGSERRPQRGIFHLTPLGAHDGATTNVTWRRDQSSTSGGVRLPQKSSPGFPLNASAAPLSPSQLMNDRPFSRPTYAPWAGQKEVRRMPGRAEGTPRAVLIVDPDPIHRLLVEQACRTAGVSVRSVGAIADVKRWPRGQIVVTTIAHLTPLWRLEGATDVIVLVQDRAEGIAALQNGATGWLRLPFTPESIAAMMTGLAVKGH